MPVTPSMKGAVMGLSAAALFGLSAPMAKRLLPYLLAGALMAVGAVLLLRERHGHVHTHEALEHEHLHVHDAHHQHTCPPGTDTPEPHSHPHQHAPITHDHPHVPDLHHRHKH